MKGEILIRFIFIYLYLNQWALALAQGPCGGELAAGTKQIRPYAAARAPGPGGRRFGGWGQRGGPLRRDRAPRRPQALVGLQRGACPAGRLRPAGPLLAL